MRLIDADDFRRRLDTYYPFTKEEQKKHGFADMAKSSVLLALVETPTVDAMPVRHGQWIGIDDEPYEVYECDQCGTTYDTVGNTWDIPYFCPHCGAKMHEPCDDCQEFDCYGCEYAEREEE